MLDYTISIKTFLGGYKIVREIFKSEEHFSHWFEDLASKGNKVIAIYNTKKQ